MNRLVIIGNGFDIAHGLKTRYLDFINWYWDQRVDSFIGDTSNVSEDCLCKLTIRFPNRTCWNTFSFRNSYFKDSQGNRTISGSEVIHQLRNNPECYGVECSEFFTNILKSIERKGWVDIENDYYQLLKKYISSPQCDYRVSELNLQLAFLQDKLIEYLSSLTSTTVREDLRSAMVDFFNPVDFSTEGMEKALEDIGINNPLENLPMFSREREKLVPKRIMLLSFNYTSTIRLYNNFNISYNYIHGELSNPQNVIFGYGDELDKDYQSILDKNDNELLRYSKSVKYLETGRYREMLEFLESAPYQVMIMGHSCGNSDRTLLNTVFEHNNCVSVKPFYYKKDDGSDNYLELVQNICRNFTEMKLFRDRVVNKEQCLSM